jgi:enolase-phosphatase E1
MIKAILTDIEGTTSSLAFVKDVLFPYARKHLAEYVTQHAERDDVRSLLDQAGQEMGSTQSDNAIIAQMIRSIDEDKKITPLKALQGMIWEHGYKHGDYTGHLYDDAYTNLQKWHQTGIKLYVYSSGSVHAQKLLFGYSDKGDLTTWFSGYFDTNIGHKREASAYQKIIQKIGFSAEQILFLSDIREELDAAQTAGMQTCWLVRDAQFSALATHRQVRSFDDIDFIGK